MRQSALQNLIPAGGADAVPYPNHHEVTNGYLKHAVEMYSGSIVGAGGAGGVLSDIPFEPAIVDIHKTAATSIFQRRLIGPAGAVDINMKDGTAAGSPIAVAVDNDGTDGNPKTWKVTLVTGLAPDAATVIVVCTGFRDIGGSL